MIVPSTVNFSTLNRGQVFSNGDGKFYMKTDDTDMVDLASGNVAGSIAPEMACLLYPNAQLVLG